MNSNILDKVTNFMYKVGQNNVIQALSGGMMLTMAISLGAAFFSLLANFPVTSVATFFSDNGLTAQFQAIYNGTMGVMALFVVMTIAYTYAGLKNYNQITSVLFAVAGFLALAPQQVGEGEAIYSAFSMSTLGASGLFVAMLMGIIMPLVYGKLQSTGKLNFKLPDTVPPMVTQSLEPVFIGIFLLFFLLVIRIGFAMTAFGDIFAFINQVVAVPLTGIGGSVAGFLTVQVLMAAFFFFGIHPSALAAAYSPVRTPILLGAIEAYSSGGTIENVDALCAYFFAQIDGTGNVLGMLIIIFIIGKSVRYKSLAKLAIVPNLFNINEPVIFGMPIVLNPILAVPFILAPLVSGLIGLIAYKIGFLTTLVAPAFLLPWTTPKIVSAFVMFGWQGSVVYIICLLAMIALYFPFVRTMDIQAYNDEQESGQ